MVDNPTPAVEVNLLPCPFCGDPADIVGTTGTFYGQCLACGALGRCGIDEDQASAYWNTRTPSRGGEVDKLREDRAEVDRLSWLLFEAWKRVDPNSGVAKHPVSYMANFADMARAVIADRAALASPPPVEGLTSGEGAFGQGRFAEWSSDTLASQCRMQARDSLDPDFMQFMEAVAVRLTSPKATATASVREGVSRKCSICGGHLFVAVDVRQFNGTYAPGPERRCINCKTTFTAQVFATLTDSGTADTHAGSVREECAAACDQIANDSVFVGDTEEGRIRHEGIIAGARNCAIAIRAALHPVDSRAQGGEKDHG